MKEFISLFESPVDVPILLFLGAFILAVSFFHSLIIHSMFCKLKPKWILFILYPCLFLVACYIKSGYAVLLSIALFISTFLLALIGGISLGIRNRIKASAYNRKTTQKNSLPKRILMVIASLVAVALFLLSGPMALFFIAAFMIVVKILFPGSEDRFLKLQTTLPTSKIRSVAMGLAEIEGQLLMIEELKAPIKQKTCIGYRHVVEEISVDDEGRESFRTIDEQTRCASFYMQDKTGKIKVSPEKLALVRLPVDEQYRSGGKRYSQYLIVEDDQMLLVGKASEENGQPVMVHEDISNMFVIAPSNSVSTWNKYIPLRQKAVVFACFVAFLVAVILVAPIEIKDNRVYIKINKEILSGFLFE